MRIPYTPYIPYILSITTYTAIAHSIDSRYIYTKFSIHVGVLDLVLVAKLFSIHTKFSVSGRYIYFFKTTCTEIGGRSA